MPGWIGAPNGPDGSYVFTSLAPGVYRVVDRRSGLASDAVEVFGAGRRSEIELDLKHVVVATGRVVAPPGTPIWMARVVVDDGVQPVEPFLKSGNVNTPGFGVQQDGKFRIVLPLKRAARLRAWHPFLRPAQQGGEVEVAESVDGLELALEEAPSLQFQPVSRCRSARPGGCASGSTTPCTATRWRRRATPSCRAGSRASARSRPGRSTS
jgi:hypothetical protein